ncbi:MAG: hypothetical protein GY842_06800, partial [bacterium]|nr:hypothetical protein [bacterium]
MKTVRDPVRRHSLWILILGVIVGSAGCSHDFDTPEGYQISCLVEVWDCPKTATPPNFTIQPLGTYTQPASYKKRSNFWGVKSGAYQAYWHPPVFVTGPGPDELPGSTMIMTGGNDWNVTPPSDRFMSVKLNEEVAGIYVAYDSRANPKPGWLLDTSKYQKLSKQLPLIMMGKGSTTPTFPTLDVYRAKGITAKDAVLTLPTNSYGNPGWSAVTKGNPAMYLVFVKPKSTVDCNKGKLKTTLHQFGCYAGWPAQKQQLLDSAAVGASSWCDQSYPNDRCKQPTCTAAADRVDCRDIVSGCTFCSNTDTTFEHSSEVTFLSASSTASGTVAGSGFNSTINGELLFEYETDGLHSMQVMHIDSMVLDVGSFETEIGEITDIKVALIAPTAAKCMDSPAPVATPCGWYQIPAAEFWTTESCQIDGDRTAFTANSTKVTDIYLDPLTHTFTIGGNLKSKVVVDDEEFDIDITLNLVGQVTNYAPKAVAEYEGDRTAECSDETNASPIYLHAGNSFDIEGTLSNNSYAWYEDLGLVTQHLWGTGPSLTIGTGQLGFGEHNITLVVTDGQGVLDNDTVTVAVTDTQPPMLEVPENIELLTMATPPIHIDIGEAFVADECLPIP